MIGAHFLVLVPGLGLTMLTALKRILSYGNSLIMTKVKLKLENVFYDTTDDNDLCFAVELQSSLEIHRLLTLILVFKTVWQTI